jgi:hypothetical protein
LYFDYFLESSPQTFRITNLTAGEYIATVVTGAFADYEEVAHTAVSSPSDPGAGMLGDRSQSGIWQHRAFRVRVGSNGTLDLRLGSRNTGSLFQSACKYTPAIILGSIKRRWIGSIKREMIMKRFACENRQRLGRRHALLGDPGADVASRRRHEESHTLGGGEPRDE